MPARIQTMLLILVFLVVFSGLNPSLHAAPMNGQQVEVAVETWLQKVITESRDNARVVRMEPFVVDGQTVAYIAHLAGEGYCLSGADDILLPVSLYAPRGVFDPENPNLQSLLEEMSSRLKYVQESQAAGAPWLADYRALLSERSRTWQDLAAGQVPARIAANKNRDFPVLMKLPVTSVWHQNSPYNSDCPTLPDAPACLVGCVATAMSQIMYYWQWPPTGTSSFTAVYNYSFSTIWLSEPLTFDPGITGDFWETRLAWTSANGGQLLMSGYWEESIHQDARQLSASTTYREAVTALYNRLDPGAQGQYANFGATSYDFGQMQDEHFDPVGGDDSEVAKLCYHAGISVDMNWGIAGSGADTGIAGDALESFFRYDPDNIYEDLNRDKVVDEIRWFRPVQLRGTGSEGGHSWVVAGYDLADAINPSFWMNLGWGPDDIDWYTPDQLPHDLLYDHRHITGIAPLNVVNFVGPEGSASGDGSPDNPFDSLDDALSESPNVETIIFKADTDYAWSGGGVISQTVTIKGIGVTISGQ